MPRPILSADACRRALAIRDLTDPRTGPHAMQLLVDDVVTALRAAWACAVIVHRASPIVTIDDNYDRLHYPSDGAARDARYTRYVSETTLLRTQTSAMVPALLRQLVGTTTRDVLLVCPGLVYRRDIIDRLHTGEPHQLDLWRIHEERRLGPSDLDAMVELVARVLLPEHRYRTVPTSHPYTTDGLQIDVQTPESWVEIGECGLALPELVAEAGLDPTRTSGLAMGLGLDRILMLRKKVPDIRLLRAEDPRIAAQMLDLSPYRSVSRAPMVRRDLSIAIAAADTAEELGDRVRDALGDEAESVEEVAVIAETIAADLPPAAASRLGIQAGQKNVLLRVVLRHPTRTLTDEQANVLRDRIYAALHRGTVHHWAARRV